MNSPNIPDVLAPVAEAANDLLDGALGELDASRERQRTRVQVIVAPKQVSIRYRARAAWSDRR